MKIALVTLHHRPCPPALPLLAAGFIAALPPCGRPYAHLFNFQTTTPPEAIGTEIVQAGSGLVVLFFDAWNRPVMLELSLQLRRQPSPPLLVAAGPEAAATPGSLLADAVFDGVITGEGEGVFPRLLDRLNAGEDPAGSPGLAWRVATGHVIGPPQPPAAAEELPSPWLNGVLRPTAGASIPWEVSRSAGELRHLPLDRLAAELDLFAAAGVSELRVLDPAFNFPPERGRELLRLLLTRAPGVQVRLPTRSDFLEQETVSLLQALPCMIRFEPFASGPEPTRPFGRVFDPEQLASRAHLLGTEGIPFGIELFCGHEGDDPDELHAFLDRVFTLRPERVDLFPVPALSAADLLRIGESDPEGWPDLVAEESVWQGPRLTQCRRLAASIALFYNGGNAAPFFAAIVPATACSPSGFLEEFATWALESVGVGREQFFRQGGWPPEEILSLQESFTARMLHRAGRGDLVPAALDLIRYHHYCSALKSLAEATPVPESEGGRGNDLWLTPWKLAPQVLLVPFSYEILALQEVGEVDLEQFAALFRPVGSVGIFLRRGEQVFCESLEENFLRLLRESNGRRSPQEIFGGSISRQEVEEIVEFAVSEGLLIRA